MKKTLFLLVSFLFLYNSLVSASVGLGISPSRMEYRIEGGKTVEATYTVYNTGTDNIIARFSADGDLKEYVKFLDREVQILPEPEPLTFPPKNGKTFTVRYSPPPTNKEHRITGFVVAMGGPAAGGTLGGNVAVAMRVDLVIGRTQHWWDRVTKTQWIVSSSILGLIIIALLLLTIARRKGIRLKFEVHKPRK